MLMLPQIGELCLSIYYSIETINK